KGIVECDAAECPSHEGCYRLLSKDDGCCKVCRGCIYGGVHHPSGTEWRDPKKPCLVISCKAGVVTESEIKCHTHCSNPLPPSTWTVLSHLSWLPYEWPAGD
ncbi:hypothetical protein L9F63_016545, partial [Diploptera punctata]